MWSFPVNHGYVTMYFPRDYVVTMPMFAGIKTCSPRITMSRTDECALRDQSGYPNIALSAMDRLPPRVQPQQPIYTTTVRAVQTSHRFQIQSGYRPPPPLPNPNRHILITTQILSGIRTSSPSKLSFAPNSVPSGRTTNTSKSTAPNGRWLKERKTSTFHPSPMSSLLATSPCLRTALVPPCHSKRPQSPARAVVSHCCPTIAESMPCGCFHPSCKHRESTRCLPINYSFGRPHPCKGWAPAPRFQNPAPPFHRLCRHCEQRA